MSGYGVRVEYIGPKGHIALVTLDRPDKRNAFDEVMWASIESAAATLRGRLPRAVVVTGAGDKAFWRGLT